MDREPMTEESKENCINNAIVELENVALFLNAEKKTEWAFDVAVDAAGLRKVIVELGFKEPPRNIVAENLAVR